MRIRRRPQPQIPISAPDLERAPANGHAGASSPVASAGGAVAGDVGLLHRVGDLPNPSGGCNVHGPPISCGAAEAGDLLGRSNLHRPVPSVSKIDNGDDGGRTAAQTLLLLLQGEQYQEAVVDAHRTWSLGGLRGANRSGAETSRSMLSVATESPPVQKRRETGVSRLDRVEESNGRRKPVATNYESTRTGTIFTTTAAGGSPDLAGVDTGDGVNNDDDDGGGGGHIVEADGKSSKRRSPAVLMEGSRCSRVNGRGWRCFRQTLVGYSLCEHHLGKGRLRSVSGGRCNGSSNSTGGNNTRRTKRRKPQKQQQQQQQPPPPSKVENGDSEDEEEELKVANSNRIKRKKAGMVKARSISSLLDQTNRAAAASTAIPIPLPAKQEEESPPSTLYVPRLDR